MRIKFSRADPLGRLIARHGGTLRSLSQLRFGLVVALIAFQSATVTESYGAVANSPLWPLGALASAALFALLGFVLQESRTHHTLAGFMLNRVRRVYPALLWSVLLTLFMLGPVFTRGGIGNYFRDGDSWGYLLNLVAVPWLTLPNVFEFNNLASVVNTYLWAVPAFAALAVTLALAPLARSREPLVLPMVGAAYALAAIGLDAGGVLSPDGSSPATMMFAGPGLSALLCGFAGAIASRWRTRIGLSMPLAIVCAVILATVALVGNAQWLRSPFFHCAITLPVVVLSLFGATRRLPSLRVIAMVQPLLAPVLLCAFPIQQAVATTAAGGASAAVNLSLALPAAFAVAFVSWISIGRRLLAPDQRAAIGQTTVDVQRVRFGRRQVWQLLSVTAIAVAVALTALAAMAVTFYALQRPPEGL